MFHYIKIIHINNGDFFFVTISRRSMVKSMTTAGQVPHFHLMDELCLTRLVALRRRLRQDPAGSGARMTFLPFILKV